MGFHPIRVGRTQGLFMANLLFLWGQFPLLRCGCFHAVGPRSGEGLPLTEGVSPRTPSLVDRSTEDGGYGNPPYVDNHIGNPFSLILETLWESALVGAGLARDNPRSEGIGMFINQNRQVLLPHRGIVRCTRLVETALSACSRTSPYPRRPKPERQPNGYRQP